MKRFFTAAIAGILMVTPVTAQLARKSVGGAVHFQGYSFADAAGVAAANLLMVPVAFELPLTSTFSIDGYTAYARGSAEIDAKVYTMTGPVDTRVRANWATTPWAIVTVGLNLPTGNSEHDAEEAEVASVLATEVLGFREASWGLGFGVTTGIATARRVGNVGLGFGASYRYTTDYAPRADTTLTYSPGNEARLRLGFDTDIGTSKLTGGVTWQHYSRDQIGLNLFQPGPRIRGDLAVSFRTSATSNWTVYATDIWRQHGDLSFQETATAAVRDSTTGTQNILVAGIAGAMRVTPRWSVRPSADLRIISREDPGNEGWMAGFGTGIPLRLANTDVLPTARFLFGRLSSAVSTEQISAKGAEVGVTVRF